MSYGHEPAVWKEQAREHWAEFQPTRFRELNEAGKLGMRLIMQYSKLGGDEEPYGIGDSCARSMGNGAGKLFILTGRTWLK